MHTNGGGPASERRGRLCSLSEDSFPLTNQRFASGGRPTKSFPLTSDTHDGTSLRHIVSPSRIHQQFVSGGRYQRSWHPQFPRREFTNSRREGVTRGRRIHSFPGANSPIHVGRSEVVMTVSPARINKFTLGGRKSLRDVVASHSQRFTLGGRPTEVSLSCCTRERANLRKKHLFFCI
jgi:hypothetical protein